jgi:heme exporter protein B
MLSEYHKESIFAIMMLLRQIGYLLHKELLMELRSSYAISGILLYVFATVFVVYRVFIRLEPNAWNAMFWIVLLFASVNAVVKSFVQESGTRQLYYYTLMNPLAVVLSKMIYNATLLTIISLLVWLGFSFLGDSPVRETGMFLIAILLGSLGFSITFTFISAISVKADNSATLMAILSFPLVIPILMTVLKLTAGALRLMRDTAINQDILILLGIDLLLVAMAIVLYPFLWRD